MTKRKVLLVPLNWGLGHATRLVPIIRKYTDKGDEVFVGGSPEHLVLFREEFPEIRSIKIPYANIKFNDNQRQIISLIVRIPLFIIQIIREHYALKKIVRKNKIDLVISDNCYGLWHRKIKSIFVTHQLTIKLPPGIKLFEGMINNVNHWLINKFDECWIPDLKNDGGYAGDLSHGKELKNKVKYIGIQSRFTCTELQ